jgi:2-methylene-furan-3-one reductase
MGISTTGALAPYTTMQEAHIARKPANVSFAEAAAMVTPGLTALQAIRYAEQACDELPMRLFVTGGPGGVAHIFIQLAKNVFEADVVATSASDSKVDFVTSLGADYVATPDRDGGSMVKQILKDGRKYDMALDCTNEFKKCRKIVKKDGVVVSITHAASKMMCIPRGVHAVAMLPSGDQLEELAKHVADEKIVVTCDTVFSLSRAPEALAYVAAGHVVGRVLVEVLEGSCGDIQPSNSAIL